MKVVALVSGGKDSCFNMMQCARYGHEIVAIANLAPPDPETHELDSWMYQTIGHQAVRGIAECMGVRFFQTAIQGTARAQGLSYEPSDAKDEVEDLTRLLSEVQQAMPQVEGVASGAILSNYQRNRVESVCSRLGLVSLGFLWQNNQRELLTDMVASGMHALIVKTAAMGLHPRRHLGKSIAELLPYFCAMEDSYGLNVCGEGGEYETFTLDCPLFHKKIVVDTSSLIGDVDGKDAPVAHFVIEKFHLEDKKAGQQQREWDAWIAYQTQTDAERKRGNAILSLANTRPLTDEAKGDHPDHPSRVSTSPAPDTQTPTPAASATALDSTTEEREFISVSVRSAAGCSIDAAVTSCFASLDSELKQHGLSRGDVFFVHVFLEDMADYGAFNAAYRSQFGINPPSRVAVQVSQPAGAEDRARVSMEFVCLRGQREVLHVQSISSWAPCNIGPYSQATQFAGTLHLAGQIGLDASTMSLADPTDSWSQACVSFANCESVLHVQHSSMADVLAAVVFTAAGHERTAAVAFNAVFEQGVHNAQQGGPVQVPALHVTVPDMPKHALVEVQLTAVQTHIAEALPLQRSFGHHGLEHGELWHALCWSKGTTSIGCLGILCPHANASAAWANTVDHLVSSLADQQLSVAHVAWLRVYVRVELFSRSLVEKVQRSAADAGILAVVSCVPVTRVAMGGADVWGTTDAGRANVPLLFGASYGVVRVTALQAALDEEGVFPRR